MVNSGRVVGTTVWGRSVSRVWPLVILAVSLGGCVSDRQTDAFNEQPKKVRKASLFADMSAEPLKKAELYYRNEDYGLAEQNFRLAVEANPRNQRAWIGLAASYDRLRRFDLAERAYGVIIKQFGYSVRVHNNLGYHYYLRGDWKKARKQFEAAYDLEPNNPLILNNLKLINRPRSG